MPAMCNRYAQAGSLAEIRRLANQMKFELETTPATDNLRALENIYPDQDAPILRAAGEKLELAMLRWGFPPIPGQSAPITNIRNLKSKWWRDVNREWVLEPRYRCLVPFSAFAEPVRDSTWFNVIDREIAFFAGIWRPWRGERLAEQAGKKRRAREERDWELFAFLTTEPNELIRPIHEKAMPVILTDADECREWLGGGAGSLHLQRPFEARAMAMMDA
jgi:putative SOS response-associated peptidase YedK